MSFFLLRRLQDKGANTCKNCRSKKTRYFVLPLKLGLVYKAQLFRHFVSNFDLTVAVLLQQQKQQEEEVLKEQKAIMNRRSTFGVRRRLTFDDTLTRRRTMLS
jgi:hypothetical protein